MVNGPLHAHRPAALPRPRLDLLLSPIRRFMRVESAGGIVLLLCTALALYLANSAGAAWFTKLWHTHVELTIGSFSLGGELGHFIINDGLMVIFFFVVGMEIKRELVAGELNEVRKALLPVFAAAGGMLVPALIYLGLQWGQPGQRGWAVPVATDIAFVVGILTLFGPRVPFSLKILLLSLAIVDDLGAVLIIAIFFSGNLAWNWLIGAGVGFVLVYVLCRLGVRRVGVYVCVGLGIWLAMYKSGIHPTVAGVLLGLMTPTREWIGDKAFYEIVGELWDRLRTSHPEGEERVATLDLLRFTAHESVAPLDRLMHALHPWVAFFIMPVFALANAGVVFGLGDFVEPVSLSVMAGLVIGKPVGVLLFCWLSTRLGLTKLPEGVSWSLLLGAACLAGIGFTMALFLNGLSFPGQEFVAMEAAGKIGTLAGSLVSALLGCIILMFAIRR